MKSLRTKNFIYPFLLNMWGIVLLLLLGEHNIVLDVDSACYVDLHFINTMPLYPLWIHFIQQISPSNFSLTLVLFQAVIMSICSYIFTKTIRKHFELNSWKTFLVYNLSLFSYLVSLKKYTMAWGLQTESLAYPLFLLYAASLFNFVWNKNYKWFIVNLVEILLLSLTRSQLECLYVVTALCFFYVWMCQKNVHLHILVRFLLGGIISGFIVIAGVLGTTYSCKIILSGIESYVQYLDNTRKEMLRYTVKDKELISYTPVEVSTQEDEVSTSISDTSESQWADGFIFKILYVADESDVQYITNPDVQYAFLTFLSKMDSEETRFKYLQIGPYMGGDIAAAEVALHGAPPQLQQIYNEISGTPYAVSVTPYLISCLFVPHIIDLLKVTALSMCDAMLRTVFFQKDSFFGLCYIIAFLIYLFSLLLIFLVKNRAKREMMLTIILTNLILAFCTCLILFSLQRYMVYMFGVFYVSLFLLFDEFWSSYITPRIKKVH